MAKKRNKKKKSSTVRIGETAPKERRQHGNISYEIIDRDASGNAYIKRQRILDECRLDAYLRRGNISIDEHEAGMKVRYAFLRHVLHVKVTDNINPFLNEHGGSDPEGGAIAACESERIMREVCKILTEKQKSVIISVCGYDEWAGDKHKIKTLHRGLERLVDLWKLGIAKQSGTTKDKREQ